MSFLDRLCRRVRPEPPVDEATVTERSLTLRPSIGGRCNAVQRSTH